jgi:clan AA aspartic protease
MGCFMEEITLSNPKDDVRVEAGLLKDIRTVTVEAMPDTGAWTLVINEEIRQKLGLEVKETSQSTLADGKTDTYDVTEGVEIRWKDRGTVLPALVVPEAQDVLLGALPLEAMDLIVDPVHKRLMGAHGDQLLHYLYEIRRF